MDLDDLYAAPYDRFISERNALAKSTDDKDEARRIKALRKPTLPAWAINQVARRSSRSISPAASSSAYHARHDSSASRGVTRVHGCGAESASRRRTRCG